MASLNKVLLIGHLGRDPELRTFPDGGTMTTAQIATTERWKDRQSGEMREAAEWHNLVFNGRLAEIAAQYLRKGSPVYVEGQLRTRKWQDKNGADRYTTEIRVLHMQMLGSRADGARAQGAQYDNSAPCSPPAPAQRSAQPPTSGGQMGMIEMSQQALAREGVHVPQYQPPAQNSQDSFDSFEDDVPF